MFAKQKTLRDQAQDIVDVLAPHVETAREALAPHVETAKEQLGPRLAEAREALAPHVETAKGQFALAREMAAPVAEEARRRGFAAADALKGEPAQKSGGKKKLLVLVGLLGGLAVAAKKLLGDQGGQQAWQSSYAPPTPAPTTGAHVAETDDAAGGTPGEALSDATEEPHAASTPDTPADVVDIDEAPESTT